MNFSKKTRVSSLTKLAPFSLITISVSFYLICVMISGEANLLEMSAMSTSAGFGVTMIIHLLMWKISHRLKLVKRKFEAMNEAEAIFEKVSIVSFFVLFSIMIIYYLYTSTSSSLLLQ